MDAGIIWVHKALCNSVLVQACIRATVYVCVCVCTSTYDMRHQHHIEYRTWTRSDSHLVVLDLRVGVARDRNTHNAAVFEAHTQERTNSEQEKTQRDCSDKNVLCIMRRGAAPFDSMLVINENWLSIYILMGLSFSMHIAVTAKIDSFGVETRK